MSTQRVTVITPEQWVKDGPEGWSYHPGDPYVGRASGWGHAEPSTGAGDGASDCVAARWVAGEDTLMCTCGARAQVIWAAAMAAIMAAIRVSKDANDDPGWDNDDDPYGEGNGCVAPGREGPELCCDDLCRGAGICLYEAARR